MLLVRGLSRLKPDMDAPAIRQPAETSAAAPGSRQRPAAAIRFRQGISRPNRSTVANAPTKAMRMVRDMNSSSMVGAIMISPGRAKAHGRIRPPGRTVKMPSPMVDESIGHRNKYDAPGM